MSKQRICYYYDGDTGNYYYGECHPMKPHRIRMAHSLLVNYGLYKKMQVYVSDRPTASPGPPRPRPVTIIPHSLLATGVPTPPHCAHPSTPVLADALPARGLRNDNLPR
jgi:hypothetical protein